MINVLFAIVNAKRNKNPLLKLKKQHSLCEMNHIARFMLLSDTGSASREKAINNAELEYKKYQENTLSEVEKIFWESVRELERKVKKKIKK